MQIPSINNELELKQFLDQVEASLEKLGNQMSELSFQKYLDKKPNTKIAELDRERAAIVLSPELRALIEAWRGKVADPALARRVEVWRNSLVGNQVTALEEISTLTRELNDKIVAHKYLLGGERVDLGTIRNVIRQNHDRELRRQAWLAYAELSQQLEADLLRLVKLRNAAAQKLGYGNYVDMILDLNDMTTAEVEGILNELTTATEDSYRKVLHEGAERLGIEQIEPWDVQICLESKEGVPSHLFPKSGIKQALRDWAATMGQDIDALGIEPVFVDIPYNGLCMTLNRHAIRILGNPQDGYGYYTTMFHELGHALHSALNEQEQMILRRDSSIFTEGIAEIFGYVPRNPGWLKTRGLSDELVSTARQSTVGPQFHYIRQRTAYCLFEYEMYRNPDQDLDTLMAKTEARILGTEVNASPRWASNAWYVSYPVYWQNYVLADVVASQVHHHLEANFGPLYNTQASFDFVRQNYIAPGASTPWLEKIASATGQPLNAKALIKDMNE